MHHKLTHMHHLTHAAHHYSHTRTQPHSRIRTI